MTLSSGKSTYVVTFCLSFHHLHSLRTKEEYDYDPLDRKYTKNMYFLSKAWANRGMLFKTICFSIDVKISEVPKNHLYKIVCQLFIKCTRLFE